MLIKKNIQQIIIFCFLFSITNILSYSQDLPGVPKQIIGPSPNAAEIGRFGAIPVGLFTGTAQYDIPIYELKNSNLSVPISLKYSSNGFVVDKLASTVGYDWSLNAGGVINCYVNGLPDGIDHSGRLSIDIHYASLSDIYQFCTQYDPPDIFSFSIPGYSGQFFKDSGGNLRMTQYNNLKITAEGYKITITTPEGVKYIFNDFTYYLNNSSASWYLSSIVHPAGDTITFTYSSSTPVADYYVNRYVYLNLGPGQGFSSTWNESLLSRPNLYDRNLERIDFNGVGSVVFTNTAGRLDTPNYPKTSKITILDANGSVLKSYDLNYIFPQNNSQFDIKCPTPGVPDEYLQSFNYRMFLDNIVLKDNLDNSIGSYKFNYNNLNNLPARFCYSKDYWGYFNGKPNNDILNLNDFNSLPSSTFSLLAEYMQRDKMNSCNRSPDATFTQYGMLNKITFPTGGYSRLYYEGHTSNIGGCRVAKTISYSQDNEPTDIKKYIYSSMVAAPSDFRYFRDGVYNYHEVVNCVCTPKYYNWIRVSPDYSADNLVGSYHLCYREVRVLNGENGENGEEMRKYYTNIKNGFQYVWGQGNVYPIKWSNNDLFNGTLLQETYSTNNKKVKQITYNYDFTSTKNYFKLDCYAIELTPNNVKNPATFGLGCDCFSLSSEDAARLYNIMRYELFSKCLYLDSKKEVVFTQNSDSIVTETTYTYCDAPYINIKSETINNINGTNLSKIYKYPFDYSAQYSNMLSNNITSPVIEQQEYIIKEGQTYLKSVLTSDYSEIKSGLFLPTKIYKMANNQPLNSNEYSTYANGLIERNQKFNLEKEFTYNSYGNPINVIDRSGLSTTYLWGYKNQYPIAEIRNATVSQVNSALQNITAEQLALSMNPDMNKVNSLRQSLSSSLVSTYTYYPSVGLATMTDARNVSTYYKYDTFNRLYLVKNNDDKVINYYKYGYYDNSDNGYGGYNITASISSDPSYPQNYTGTATINVVGGSGDYRYEWSLLNGNSTLQTGTNSSAFNFFASTVGTLTLRCIVTDNNTGQTTTVTKNITCTGVTTIYGNFTFQSGYTNSYNSLSSNGTTVSFVLAFLFSSSMSPGVNYHVAWVPGDFRPSVQRVVTLSSGGRTWNVTFSPQGMVYCQIVSGSTLSNAGMGCSGTYNL